MTMNEELCRCGHIYRTHSEGLCSHCVCCDWRPVPIKREDKMFTTGEYETAAGVMAADVGEGHPLVLDLLRKAKEVDRREKYALLLGKLGLGEQPGLRGARILLKLQQDGWTAPEGLL